MPTYSIEGPDGRTYSVEGPAGASRSQVIAEIERQQGGKIGGAKPKADAGADVAKSGATGIGKGVVGLARMAEDVTPLGMTRNVLNAVGIETPAMASSVGQNMLSQFGHKPETRAGRYAEAVGEQVPNVLAPGGAVRRVASVVLPGAAGEGAREGASALGFGETGQAVAKFAGNLLGGVGATSTPTRFRPSGGPVGVLASRAKADPKAMADKATEMRAAGVEPTLANVVGPRGRRVLRAVGVKNDLAGEALTKNARSVSSSAKPAIMDRTRELGPMQGKTADQLVAELLDARSTAATKNFAPAYETPVKLDENILRALSDEPGKAALRRARSAAVARMDDARVKEIDSILNADMGPPEIAAFHGSPTKGLTNLEPRRQSGTFDFPPVVSLSTDAKFAGRYAGEGGQVYPAAVSPKNAGDFRKPEDVQAVISFYERQHGPLDANDIEAIKHGSWRLWENADLWRERGWRGAFAREEPGTPNADTLNLSLASGDDVRLGATPKPHTAPPEQVSAATLDRVQIAMRERAKSAQRRDAGDMASGLNARRGMINRALDDVEALKPARQDYRNKSQAIDVIGRPGKRSTRADVFSTDPADYGRWLETLSPEAREANKVAIRQEVLDTLGKQRPSTMGSIEELAGSDYAQQNLRQALGPEADQYVAHLNAKLEQVRDARFMDPEAGSRTAVLQNDLGGVMRNVGGAAMDAKTGNFWGLMTRGVDALKSRGISDRDAQALVQMAIDPKRTDEAIQIIAQRLGPDAARAAIDWRRAALLAAPAAASAQSAGQ